MASTTLYARPRYRRRGSGAEAPTFKPIELLSSAYAWRLLAEQLGKGLRTS